MLAQSAFPLRCPNSATERKCGFFALPPSLRSNAPPRSTHINLKTIQGMKKISTLALGLALLAGSAVTAKAQITVPKVSDDANTYLYYLQNAGSNNKYYVTTMVGDNNVVKYADSGTKLQVKLVASGTDSKYNIVATNLGDGVETTYIGVAGTSSKSSVTYYTEATKQNAEWSVTATTHSSAKGYFPLYNIALTSSLGWNMYGGTTGSTVALYANTDRSTAGLSRGSVRSSRPNSNCRSTTEIPVRPRRCP